MKLLVSLSYDLHVHVPHELFFNKYLRSCAKNSSFRCQSHLPLIVMTHINTFS